MIYEKINPFVSEDVPEGEGTPEEGGEKGEEGGGEGEESGDKGESM